MDSGGFLQGRLPTPLVLCWRGLWLNTWTYVTKKRPTQPLSWLLLGRVEAFCQDCAGDLLLPRVFLYLREKASLWSGSVWEYSCSQTAHGRCLSHSCRASSPSSKGMTVSEPIWSSCNNLDIIWFDLFNSTFTHQKRLVEARWSNNSGKESWMGSRNKGPLATKGGRGLEIGSCRSLFLPAPCRSSTDMPPFPQPGLRFQWIKAIE